MWCYMNPSEHLPEGREKIPVAHFYLQESSYLAYINRNINWIWMLMDTSIDRGKYFLSKFLSIIKETTNVVISKSKLRLEAGVSCKDRSLRREEVQSMPSSDVCKKANLDRLIPRDRGYTAAGFIFNGGAVVATDHLSKSHVPNIIELNSRMVAAVSVHGGSANMLIQMKNMYNHEFSSGRRTYSVEETSKWFAHLLPRCSEGSSVEMLIGGFDKCGPALYRVDGKGAVEDCKKEGYAATGCGDMAARALLRFWF
ncbi:OLC1v1025170C1 [Oldenlandia corymbosa var. corymbosa]|uniref:OLC1v1025170C1 n=1 Tax=Oldenlandia corymbosa var. corymbosa TaxID=529605 RepID=A0AAV1C4G2_OLDCO|nr:OLC1v1025170C1 [Oldenlandia corymbosa var. corymbosa]